MTTAPARTPLALRNLMHHKAKTVIAVAGVAFCLVLIFMQLGFFNAVVETATVVLSRLDFDAAIVARDYQFLFFCGNFPEVRLQSASSVEGVRSIRPLYIGASTWLCPPDAAGESRRRTMMVIGMRPPLSAADAPLLLDDMKDQWAVLRRRDHLLMDRRSRSDFGPIEVGAARELGYRQTTIGGSFAMGTGFGADGSALVSDATFRDVVPGYPREACSIGLVKFDDPSAIEPAIARLRDRLPPDVQILNRSQIQANDVRYWVIDTPIGVIFLSGVLIAFFVGVVVTYQTLANDIASHFAEYATLKAMGYADRFLSGVVLRQALCLAAAGYVPALAASLTLYRWTEARAQIPMRLAFWIAALVGALSFAMCATSAMIAVRKVKTTDPAELF